jgi:hypothetical protein
VITLLCASLFADKLSPDVDASSIWHLAMFEFLFDALVIGILVAIIVKAIGG